MFQIKDFRSIAAAMLNWFTTVQTQVTDVSQGSPAAVLLEAPAAELDELYQQMFIGLTEAIPVSVFNSFAFAPLPATAATGTVRVTITASASATVIPAGTAFTTPANASGYTSATDVTIAAGNTYADVLVASNATGAAGNLAAAAAFTLSPAPAGFVSASNAAAFSTGADAESDTARKARFGAYVLTLAKGTPAALEYGASTVQLFDALGNITERVIYAKCVEPYNTDTAQPIGLVNVYVHNGVGSTSGALVTQVATVLAGYTTAAGVKVPGYKAAGVHLVVAAATETTVPVTATISVQAGYDGPTLQAATIAIINNYILSLPLGASFVRAALVGIVMDQAGLTNFVMSVPSSDTAAAANVKLMPGTVAVTVV
jgi:uncharacterized phage protein gp47/JayE